MSVSGSEANIKIEYQKPDLFEVIDSELPFLVDLKYTYEDNLIGRPLLGYTPNIKPCLTKNAIEALLGLHNKLQTQSVKKAFQLSKPKILLLDTYRPQRACEDFWRWAHSDCDKTKNEYYPNVDKKDFFELGYIARYSSHCRGSTIDLTIVDTADSTIQPVDMGTNYDFMDPLSHPDNQEIGLAYYQKRQFFKSLLLESGFQGIDEEWWHFTLIDEPYQNTYFDFPFPTS